MKLRNTATTGLDYYEQLHSYSTTMHSMLEQVIDKHWNVTTKTTKSWYNVNFQREKFHQIRIYAIQPLHIPDIFLENQSDEKPRNITLFCSVMD